MSSIPRDFIDTLINRINIVDIIESAIPLRKTGTNYAACCPFHQEKTPSFTVSATKQFYYCFGCGAHGNAISFLMAHDHLSFPEAIEALALRSGIPLPTTTGRTIQEPLNLSALYAQLEQATQFYEQQLRHPQYGEKAVQYLKNRGISGKTAKIFRIGTALPGWQHLLDQLAKNKTQQEELIRAGLAIKNNQGRIYDRFRDRIIFPIRDQRGRVIGFGGRVLADDTPKYLNSPETPLFQKIKELYGLYEMRKHLSFSVPILIVEGYMDVLTLAQHGLVPVVATLGTATSIEHLKCLFRHTHEIVFCFDGDSAGQKAALRALNITLAAISDGKQARFMFLPKGEDPDSLVNRDGAEAFRRAMLAALPITEFFLQHLLAQSDVSRLDGKARIIKLAHDALAKLPNQILRDMLYDELAKRLQLPRETLHAPIPKNIALPRRNRVLRIANYQQQPSLIRQILILLIQNPRFIQHIPRNPPFAELRLPGIELLLQTIQYLQLSPNATTAHLLESWRDTDKMPIIAKLATRELSLPESSLEQEFLDALQQLMKQSLEQKLECLLARARAETLNTEEKQELQALILATKQANDI